LSLWLQRRMFPHVLGMGLGASSAAS
jgi:hypothetical protein